jgi:hypothetical protein
MKSQFRNWFPLTLLLAATLVPAVGGAQATAGQPANPNRIVVQLSHPTQPAKINLRLLTGDINVRGYSGSEIIIEGAGVRVREPNVPEEARGMRRLSQAGGVNADEENNVVTIRTGLPGGDVNLQVPSASSLSLKVTSGNIQVQGVSGDFDLECTSGGITLDQVGGSIVAHALNGGVTAIVARLDAEKPSSFSTLNGRIDVTLPADVHADLNLRSDQGDIYIDQGFDLKKAPTSRSPAKPESNGLIKLRTDNTIRGAINGGGVAISLRSFNGNILLHKGK